MKHGRTAMTMVLGLFVAAMASAHPRDGGQERGVEGQFGDQHREMRIEKMTEVLDLDEGQAAQVEAILEAAHQRHAEQREASRARHEQLRSLLDSESANPAQVGALMIEMHQNRQQMKFARERTHSEIAALLTADQLERLDAVKEMRSERKWRKGEEGQRTRRHHRRHQQRHSD